MEKKINLYKFCRVCLCESDDMRHVLSSNERIFEMFTSITNIEIEINEDSLPFKICDACEGALTVSYNFREQCQNSHKYLTDYCEKLDESKAADSCEENNEVVVKKEVARLSRFEYDEVREAIENTRRAFYENTTCIRCGFTGSNSRALSVHVTHVHKELKGRWCSKCNEEFDNLIEHQQTHSSTTCQFCNKQFQAKGHLTEHLRSHSDLRPYPCNVCEKTFISKRHLKVHLRTHTGENPYKCTICSKSFKQYYCLREHYKGHKTEEGVCIPQNFCNKCNKNVRSLKMHDKRVHSMQANGSDGILNTLCTVCGKQFKCRSKLKIHMRIHTGETPYKCSYCGRMFATRYQVVVHERTHTGERPHICHVCGKSFTQSSVLNTHMKRHTGRPVACKICDQRFCRPAELQLHLRKHTGEKPYLCSECGQAFIQRSHLVEHNKTHSDLRPYQCNFCDKAFKQSSSLKSHLRIHSGEKPYQCSHCPYACRQSYSLTQHMKQHNNDEAKIENVQAASSIST